MEERVQNYVFSEKAEPARRIVRSDGALYVLLLLAVVGIIMLGTAGATYLGIPRAYTQLTLYLILIGVGIAVYRTRLLAFRYTLTDRMLTVDRIVGRKEKPDAHIHLADIVRIRPFASMARGEGGRRASLYHGKREAALAVTCRTAEGERTLLLSPSDEMKERLIAQWKTARRS